MGRSKNKKNYSTLIAGIVIGAVIASLAGAVVFQKVTGKNVKNHIFYAVDISKKYVDSAWQKTFAKSQFSEKDADDDQTRVLQLNIAASNLVRHINPLIYGTNLPAKVEFEMNIAKFGRDLGLTNYRFPGGGSSGYHWKLGKFEFSDRYNNAPLSNIENVIKFIDLAEGQLVIQVNVESGTAQEAAEWVHYMNVEGHSRVDYWELGNEAYGDWDRAYMSGTEYANLVREYSMAMKRIDPTIKIGANWGGPKYNEFDKAVLQWAADHIDFLSYHWYPNHINAQHRYKGRAHPHPSEIMANHLAVESIVQRYRQMVRDLAPHREGKIELTVMEWDGSWDAVPSDLNNEYKGMMWSLANAIFYADALGQFARHGITVANHYTFQEVMFGLIRGWDQNAGWGGMRWDGKTIRPKALALQMMAKHFGNTLVESTLTGSPSYHKEADWRADSYAGQVPYVEAYVSKTAQGRTIEIVFTNKHASKDFQVNVTVDSVDITDSKGRVWILNGPGLKAQNDGSPGKVSIKEFELSNLQNKFAYNIPAHSVNLLKIPYN